MTLADWINALSSLKSDAVVITVLETKGSVPREAGTKMLVGEKEIQGTIGGGNLEYQCIRLATERLTKPDTETWIRTVQRFPLGATLGQCCGGLVIVMLEYISAKQVIDNYSWVQQLTEVTTHKQTAVLVTPLDNKQNKFLVFDDTKQSESLFSEADQEKYWKLARTFFDADNTPNAEQTTLTHFADSPNYYFEKLSPSRFHITLFGAGHVGQALVKALADIDCHILWVDSRQAQFPDLLAPNALCIPTDEPTKEVEKAPANSCFIIMTHNHQLDQDLCEAVLKREDFRFCGLIGSLTKKQKFIHRLRARGLSENQIEKMTCPIGISGISGKEPAVIAASVAAQLLTLN